MSNVTPNMKDNIEPNSKKKRPRQTILSYRSPVFSLEMGIQLLFLGAMCAISRFRKEQTHLLLLAFTIDGLFSAISFLRIHLTEEDLTQSQTLSHLRSLYHVSVLDRYVFYIFLSIIYKVLLLIFWSHGTSFFYYTLIISLCPILLNKIFQDYLSGIHYRVNKEKTRLIRICVAHQVASLINLMSHACVNLRPNVQYTELLPLFRNLDQTLRFFYSFLTSFLIATLIQYTKSSGNRFYAKLIRYFYNYKTGDFIGGINDKKAREKFIEVIVHRQWDRLLLPDTLQSFFYIYKTNPDSDIIRLIVTQIHYGFIKTCSIWSFSAFIGWTPIAPALSLFLFLYKTIVPNLLYKWRTQNIQENYSDKDAADHSGEFNRPDKYIEEMSLRESYQARKRGVISEYYSIVGEFSFRILAMSLGLTGIWFGVEVDGIWSRISRSYLLLTLLSEYGYGIIFNKPIVSTFWTLKENFWKLTNIGLHFNNFNFFLLSSLIFIKGMTLDCLSTWQIVCLQLPFNGPCTLLFFSGIYAISNFENMAKKYLLLIYLVLGLISDYSTNHLVFLIGLSYLAFNFIHHCQPDFFENYRIQINDSWKESPEQVLINTDTFKIFESYYPTNKADSARIRSGVARDDFFLEKIRRASSDAANPKKSSVNRVVVNKTPEPVVTRFEEGTIDPTLQQIPTQPWRDQGLKKNPYNETLIPTNYSGRDLPFDNDSDLSRSYYLKRAKNLPNRLSESSGPTYKEHKKLE